MAKSTDSGQEEWPKGYVTSIGSKLEKDDYFYRVLTVTDEASGDEVEGEHWSKTEATIDAHEKFKKDKTLVSYTWTKGAKGRADRLGVYKIKEKDDSEPSGKSTKGKSSYSNYNKGEGASKNGYWEGKSQFDEKKWAWEQERYTKNDKKIEFQAYLSAVSPFYIKQYEIDSAQAIENGKALPKVSTYVSAARSIAEQIFEKQNDERGTEDGE